MKYGLHFTNTSKEEDWLRESDKSICIWNSADEADDWRKKHTVNPKIYDVKKVTPKIIKEDQEKYGSNNERSFKIE
jgi:hypothetical protein